jgi:prepilin-type N-terminal cleavage/methylation domain-containing protein/prepilin-type processing-associated H-X9-DG protein
VDFLHAASYIVDKISNMRTSLSVQQTGRASRRRSAFTLLELLAVLTIILVVVGLLSAALNQTRTRTLRVTCLDNMRQLQLAWRMYAEDNNEHVALNKTAPPLTVGGVSIAAAPRNSTNSWVAGNPKEDRTWQTLAQGTLYPYVKHPEVYRCPMDSSTTKAGNPRTRSYSIDAYLGGDDEDVDPRVKMRLTDVVNPSPDKVFVFIEEHENSIWSGGFMVLPRDKFPLNGGAWSSTPSDRHMQGCNLTFVDGHLEYWKWMAPKKAVSASKVGNTLINAPNELRDLRRLQDAVPRP